MVKLPSPAVVQVPVFAPPLTTPFNVVAGLLMQTLTSLPAFTTGERPKLIAT